MPGRLPPYPDPDAAGRKRVAALQDLLERLQIAESGSVAFDAAIVDAFRDPADAGSASAGNRRLLPGPHCSTVLVDVMALLPADYNFSLGRRDGVCWAWIQPNDDWRPADGEARHDHPGGSGLAVADTPVLAVACAALRLHIGLIKQRQRSALHRLIFASRSTLADPDRDLHAMVGVARANNARDGVTGVLLLYEDGMFVQILEGSAEQLGSTFARISTDRRHADLEVLQSVPISARNFPGWPLGFAGRCFDRPRFEDAPARAAADVLERLLQMEYQQDHWAPGD